MRLVTPSPAVRTASSARSRMRCTPARISLRVCSPERGARRSARPAPSAAPHKNDPKELPPSRSINTYSASSLCDITTSLNQQDCKLFRVQRELRLQILLRDTQDG